MNSIKSAGQRFFALFSDNEANQNEISLFDVKSLYDSAYEERAKARSSLKRFKSKLKQAEVLDLAYRAQLQRKQAQSYTKAA